MSFEERLDLIKGAGFDATGFWLGPEEDLVAKGLDQSTILRQSLLTPQCGLGGLDEEWTEKALHTLNGLSTAVREKYRLEG
jgi:hypothetical protein